MIKVLVVGAAQDSLGQEIANLLRLPGENIDVVTAGISGDEDVVLNIETVYKYHEFLLREQFDHIICTVGINEEMEKYQGPGEWMECHMFVNCIGPMILLRDWLLLRDPTRKNLHPTPQFIAVSSNSAHIARSNSMAYCASKAALSMSLRVAAREEGAGAKRAIIYGYEPGLIMGTPMTEDTERRFGPSQTRIPGQASGLDRHEVARQIVATMRVGTWAMNGVLVRLDGGEQ